MYEKGIKPRLDALCLLLSSSGGEGNEKGVMGGSITHPIRFSFGAAFTQYPIIRLLTSSLAVQMSLLKQ